MSVDEPEPPEDRVTLVGLVVEVSPVGVVCVVRVMVPEKLLMLARLMAEVPVEPDWIVRLDGLLEIVKSGLPPPPTVTALDATPVAPFVSVTPR